MRSLLIGALCLCAGGAFGYFEHDRISALRGAPTMQVAKGPSPEIVPATKKTVEEAPADEPVETTEAPAPAETGPPPTPREAVSACLTCHGLDGIAKIPIAPHLAGESRVYIETQLKAFRNGKREHEMMTVIAEGMTDADIKAAAKWYAAIEITASVPE